MEVVLAMSAASCAAALLTASRVFGFKRLIRNPTMTDVVFTLGSVAVLGGTLTGALTAILAGLLMALFLSTANALWRGYERLTERFPALRKADHDEADDLPSSGDWAVL